MPSAERASRRLPWWLRLLVTLGTIAVILIGILLVAAGYTAVQPTTEHASCTVSEVRENAAGRRTLSSVTVTSNCGEMTGPSFWGVLIDEGETYDITVRGFPWEKPTIIEALRAD